MSDDSISYTEKITGLLASGAYVLFGNQLEPSQEKRRVYYGANRKTSPDTFYPLLFVASALIGLAVALIVGLLLLLLNIGADINESISGFATAISEIQTPKWDFPYIDILPALTQAYIDVVSIVGEPLVAFFGVAVFTYIITSIKGWGMVKATGVSISLGVFGFIFVTAWDTLFIGSILGLIMVLSGALVTVMSFFIGDWMLVANQANNRGRKIDTQEYHILTALAGAVSRGGVGLIEVMRQIAMADNLLEESSDEAKYFVAQVQHENLSVVEALDNSRKMTPSSQLESMFDDLTEIVSSGGDLVDFFENQTDRAERAARRRSDQQRAVFEQVGQIVNIMLFAPALTLFFSLGGMVGSDIVSYVIYMGSIVIIGLAGFMMILLRTPVLPDSKTISNAYAEWHDFDRHTVSIDGKDRKMKLLERWVQFKKFGLSSPVRWLRDNPLRILIVTIPITILYYIVVGLSMGELPTTMKAMQDWWAAAPVVKTIITVFIPVHIINFVPLSIFAHKRDSREAAIRDRASEFFRQIRSNNSAGRNIEESWKRAAEGNQSILADEAKQALYEMRWSDDLNNPLVAFANRLKEPIIVMSVRLILTARESTSNIEAVLNTISNTIDMTDELREMQVSDTASIRMVIMMTVFLTMGMLMFMAYQTLPKFKEVAPATDGASGGPTGGSGMSFEIPNIEYIFVMMVHYAFILATGGPMIFGALKTGKVTTGLKYSVIFSFIALVGFLFVPL